MLRRQLAASAAVTGGIVAPDGFPRALSAPAGTSTVAADETTLARSSNGSGQEWVALRSADGSSRSSAVLNLARMQDAAADGVTRPVMGSAVLLSMLNHLCPSAAVAAAGHSAAFASTSAMVASPESLLTSLPLWAFHDETGEADGLVKQVAGMLPLPVFGLSLGKEADRCALEKQAGVGRGWLLVQCSSPVA